MLKTVEMLLAKHEKIFQHGIAQAKDEILAHIDKRFVDLDTYRQEEVDDKLSEMDKEIYDAMATKVDEDNLDEIKLEPQDYVKEELKEMNDKMVKRLKGSSWNLEMDSDSDSDSK